MKTKHQQVWHIRIYLGVFIALLVLSGITAFPLKVEMDYLYSIRWHFPVFMRNWIEEVYTALAGVPELILYGTDWLAFAHIVLGLVFIGPFVNPVKNMWVIQFGMLACILVFPLAFICGSIRGIPFFHQLIDCAFGFFGFIPLFICYKKTRLLEAMSSFTPGTIIN